MFERSVVAVTKLEPLAEDPERALLIEPVRLLKAVIREEPVSK